MELCLIVPAEHCYLTSLLPGRFCLANVKHDGYRAFFAQAARRGYEVVLDNGTFEGELVDDARYIDVIREIKPQVVVVPDLLNTSAHTNLAYAETFIDAWAPTQYNPKTQLMFVPQCERDDVDGYKSALKEAIRSEHFQWIGICRNACFNAFGQFTHTEDETMNKFFFGAWAEQNEILKLAREYEIRFHLLGIGGDLSMLMYFWWISRADTASLFFQATLGQIANESGVLAEDVSRPSDYFRRDFGPSEDWSEALRGNCVVASVYATTAARLRHKILKDRI